MLLQGLQSSANYLMKHRPIDLERNVSQHMLSTCLQRSRTNCSYGVAINPDDQSGKLHQGQTFTYTCDNYVTYTCIRHLHMQAILLRHMHMRPLFLHDLHMLDSGFRGGVSGWGRDDVRPTWKNVARHSKDTSTCTLLYLETSGFQGGVSGWGRDDVRPAW